MGEGGQLRVGQLPCYSSVQCPCMYVPCVQPPLLLQEGWRQPQVEAEVGPVVLIISTSYY